MGSWVGARLEGLTGWCSDWASACLAAGPWKGEGVGFMTVCIASKEQGPLGRQGHSLGHFPLSLSCGLGHWRRWWRWRQRPMRKDHHRYSERWGEGLNFKEQKSELGSEEGLPRFPVWAVCGPPPTGPVGWVRSSLRDSGLNQIPVEPRPGRPV